MKKIISCLLSLFCVLTMSAQTLTSSDQYSVVNKVVEEQKVVDNDHQVISNKLKDNWFVLADAGINAYWGDYTSKTKFTNRLTPHFNAGFGKWFLPSMSQAPVKASGITSLEI